MLHKFERLFLRVWRWFSPRRQTKRAKLSRYRVVPTLSEDYRMTDWYRPWEN